MKTVYYIHRNGITTTEDANEANRASENGYMVTAEVVKE